jgi:hypothetical protein
MNIVLLTITFAVFRHFAWPMEYFMLTVWCWWLLWLPCNTWRDYLAAMNFRRLSKGGTVMLPEDPEEHRNEPDGEWVVKWVLWLPGAMKNMFLAQLACIFYFWAIPKPWIDVGLTKLINRMDDSGGRRGEKARAVRKRWLSRYAPEGFHK